VQDDDRECGIDTEMRSAARRWRSRRDIRGGTKADGCRGSTVSGEADLKARPFVVTKRHYNEQAM